MYAAHHGVRRELDERVREDRRCEGGRKEARRRIGETRRRRKVREPEESKNQERRATSLDAISGTKARLATVTRRSYR